jgi:putative transposase
MPHVQVWIHFVWTTKNRQPFLTREIRQSVFEHIYSAGRAKGIFIDTINGFLEHVHCLVSLGTEQTISGIVKQLKGESSHWINQNGLCPRRFSWQHEYFAVGVCESILNKTRDYIRDQENHHGNKSFDQEFRQMLGKYGFQRYADDEE